jgi:hypothetical protein
MFETIDVYKTGARTSNDVDWKSKRAKGKKEPF